MIFDLNVTFKHYKNQKLFSKLPYFHIILDKFIYSMVCYKLIWQ